MGLEDQLRGALCGETSTNITTIVWTVNTPKVFLLSAAPLKSQLDAAGNVNGQLQQLADESGWTFLGAAAGVRNSTQYFDKMSSDGKIPDADGPKVIGAEVKAAILPPPWADLERPRSWPRLP